MPANLRAGAQRGVRWGGAVGLVEQLLSVLVTIVLTRLLTPADFGLVTIATVVAQMAGLVTQVGVSAILVKRREVDSTVASTAFWTLLSLSTALAVAVTVAAEPLAALAGNAAAAPLLVVLMSTLVLRAAASVPRALLQRQMRFRPLYLADLLAFVVYAIAQVVLAVLGAGVWSIVIGQLVSATVLLLTVLALARWLPRPRFSWGVVREEWRFAGGLLATMVLSFSVKNADYVIVSWFGGAELLGVYYIAYVLPSILRQRLTWLTAELLLPVFSRIRDDRDRSRAAYVNSLALHTLVGMPAMVGIALTAEPLLSTFFGTRWQAGAAALRLIALAAAIEFMTQAATTVFTAHSRTRTLSSVPAVRLVAFSALCGALLGSTGFSLQLVAAAVLGSTAVAGIYAQWRVFALLGLPVRAALPGQLSIGASAILMTAAVLAVGAVDGEPLLRLVVMVLVGGLTMALSVRLLFWRWLRTPANEAIAIVLPRWNPLRRESRRV